MALETLTNAGEEAARLLGVSHDIVGELHQPRIVMEDTIIVEGKEIPVYRAHSGSELGYSSAKPIAKGGFRADDCLEAGQTLQSMVEELSVEMFYKLAALGLLDKWMGGKGLMGAKPKYLGPRGMEQAVRRFENCMEDAGLAGYDIDVPAADVGTNGLVDVYAREYQQNNPGDRNWAASITGKSPDCDGLPFRGRATSWGTYIAQRTIMDARGDEVARTAVQGFGNVGAWHAFYASNDPKGRMPVNAISDIEGTLYTQHPDGIKITAPMVERIGERRDLTGSKIGLLYKMIKENQPDLELEILGSEDIFSCPTDYFVPAALGNVINADTVKNFGAQRGVIEAGNGPTTPDAHRFLTAKGLWIAPDFIANSGGVNCSIKEWEANIEGHLPSTEVVQHALAIATKKAVQEMLMVADRFKTRDLRIAAAGVSLAHILRSAEPWVHRELLAAA